MSMGKGGLKRAAKLYPSLNVRGLEVLDLRTLRPDGQPWDFSRPKDRAWATRLVHQQRPRWIIASPPCTAVSVRNWNLNYGRMNKEDVERKIEEGLVHIRFVCKLYRHQLKTGGYFLHEHPRGSKSWKTDPIRSLLRREDVHVVRCDQCQFGATNSEGADWKDGVGVSRPPCKSLLVS